MAEKTKPVNHVKHVPKDAQVIMSIMKDMGISEYEPRVINQLLEFTYRYITCTLDDSKIYANHAKKKFIDLDDVRLAVKMQSERTFINPPPRDVLLDVARAKNNIPLPFVKPNNGLRLPPDRYCLNTTNYRLKPSLKKPIGKTFHSVLGNNIGGQSRAKADSNKGSLAIVKRPGTLSTVSRTQTISIPKPVFKFTTVSCSFPKLRLNPNRIYFKDRTHLCTTSTTSGASGISGSTSIAPSTPASKPKIQMTTNQMTSFVKMETDESLKRKREEEDYDVP